MSSPSIHTEKELLQQVADGSETAFSELFYSFHPKVYQAGLMLLHSPDMAEELVQDVFLKIWLKRQQLTGVQNFPSYLFIIARNLAYHKLRRQIKLRKITAHLGREQAAYSSETDELIVSKDHREILEEAINRLPPQQQQVFRLSKLEGLKREEVAAQLQIQPNTVKEHLAKAIKNIRAHLVSKGLTPAILLFIINRW